MQCHAAKRNGPGLQETIAIERLLVFNVKQGWQPLCDFLGVPVPDEPFPNTNDQEHFKSKISELECLVGRMSG
jgi:Sulfotransferase domain